MLIQTIVRVGRDRRATAAWTFALLLPVIIGILALSIDSGVLCLARAQLSSAADAAALAGAQQLASDTRLTGAANMTSLIALANNQAVSLAGRNQVLGQPVDVVGNPYNTVDSSATDVLVGYIDPTAAYSSSSTLLTTPASAQLFNAVSVTASRSPSRTGVVPAFFSSVMGFHGSSISVSSTALAWNYSIAGFRTTSNGLSAHMLPIVLDVDTYNAMMAGVGTTIGAATDQYTWNPTTQTVTSGPDGVPESVLYPVESGNPGNWGTIKVGVDNNSTSILNDQILNGISPSELATFPNGTIALDTSLTPPSITFPGNPGISAGIKSSLTAIIGDPVTIPIYDLTGGNGSNAWYRVIAFAGMRIMAVNFQGNPKYVIIQPAFVKDPTAIPGTAQSSWTKGGLIVLHLVH
jgi:Flp pilus assembly protein TadG